MAENVAWTQPKNPPPPLFAGAKERDFVKQINDELIERVIGQTILYYPISLEHTRYHPLYGEAIHKSFLSPVKINALVNWEGQETTTTNYGIDRRSKITIHFHKRRLTEDQDLKVQEGDFVLYGKLFYEIVSLNEPKQLFGQVDNKMEIAATCIRARDGVFEEAALPEVSIAKYKLGKEVVNNVCVFTLNIPDDCKICVPKLSGADPNSLDYKTLQEFVSDPDKYVGYQFYLTDPGASPVGKFVVSNKWYFNEDSTWYPSPFFKRDK
jgi:hypothetical protein